jgi:hypothetical protein
VEDESLLHLAGLPFAREVGFPSAASRPLDVEAMERSLRAQAREAEQRLAAAASRAPLAWSFRVTRGTLPEALLEAALEAELLVSGFAPGPGIPFEVAAVSPDGESASETLRALCERHGVRFLRAANEKELKKLLRALRRTG